MKMNHSTTPFYKKDECGVFGIYSKKNNVSQDIFLGLHGLQHRGQESAGIAIIDEEIGSIKEHKGLGLVAHVFDHKNAQSLRGNIAISHVRYSTAGQSTLANAQPITGLFQNKPFSVAHNGNLTNSIQLKKQLLEKYPKLVFKTTADSEVIMHLIAKSTAKTLTDAVLECTEKIQGAYSLLILGPEQLIGLRDPQGFRPLSLGQINDDYCFSSETCAINLVDGRWIRDLKINEMVIISKNKIESRSLRCKPNSSMCVFELIYLARPDSILWDRNVYQIRQKLGRQLARCFPINADIVSPIPDSGIPAALGYAKESGIEYENAILRDHYIGRTFIEPESTLRKKKVKIKLNPIHRVIKDKRVILVDDSIVRGTTGREIIRNFFDRGAKEVHILSTCPPVAYPCFYGIDTPYQDNLIAAIKNNRLEDIRHYLGATSLNYMPLSTMLETIKEAKLFCTACFSGKYPVELIDFNQSYQLKKIPTMITNG